jgi:hypothetical protein
MAFHCPRILHMAEADSPVRNRRLPLGTFGCIVAGAVAFPACARLAMTINPSGDGRADPHMWELLPISLGPAALLLILALATLLLRTWLVVGAVLLFESLVVVTLGALQFIWTIVGPVAIVALYRGFPLVLVAVAAATVWAARREMPLT